MTDLAISLVALLALIGVIWLQDAPQIECPNGVTPVWITEIKYRC